MRPHWSRKAVATLLVGMALLAGCADPFASKAIPTTAGPSPSAGSRYLSSTVGGDLGNAIESWRGKRDTRASIRAIIVSADDFTVLENYYGTMPDVSRDMESVTKSITATLVGVALQRGDLASVDQELGELLPAYAPVMPPEVAAISLRQLLTMTAGVPDWTEHTSPMTVGTHDWVASILQTMKPTPKGAFAYSNPDPHLIAAILQEATGMSLLDYGRQFLFGPLNIDTDDAIAPPAVPDNVPEYEAASFAWPVDPQGINLGFALLKLKPVDMLKIGTLYLNGGRWNGVQVLPPGWVQEATTAQAKTYDTWDSYGYLWWVTTADGEPAFAAVGKGGQLIEAIPGRRLLVVVASEYDAFNPSPQVEDPYDLTSLVSDVIAPEFRERVGVEK